MNNINKKPPTLFMHSGCLTAETLDLFVSGSMKGTDLSMAEQHIAICPLCADAAEGLRLWLEENPSTDGISENPDSASRELFGEQSSEHSRRSKSKISKPTFFQDRIKSLNSQIWQRIYKHKQVDREPGKRLSYKPFVWLSAAAMLVLFIGGFYTLWTNNQLENNSLAQKLKTDSSLKYDMYGKLPFPPSETKSVLTIVYDRKKGVQAPPVLAILTEEVPRAVSNDVLVKGTTTDDVEFSEYRYMKKSGVREDESNTYRDSRTNSVPFVRHGGAAMKKGETGDESETVLTYATEMPSFPGGDSQRLKFLSKNIRYPQQASENGVQGTVFVSFVVKKDGSLSDIKTLRGIGGGCDEEAIRVVKKMPRWNPGYQNGKKVSVLFNMKIDFKLE